MQECTKNMRFKVKNFPTGTINKTSVFRKNLRKALKDRKYTIEKFAEIVDMSMGKIQRFQNPLQKGTISLEDAIKVSSTLNISLEEMCGIEHIKFEPRQTRALRDYLTKQKRTWIKLDNVSMEKYGFGMDPKTKNKALRKLDRENLIQLHLLDKSGKAPQVRLLTK